MYWPPSSGRPPPPRPSTPTAKLAFAYPAEGFPLYCDCAAILRESRRYELAHDFLEFLLLPDVAAANARAADTATANGAAQATAPARPSPLSARRNLRQRSLAPGTPLGRPALPGPPLDGDKVGMTTTCTLHGQSFPKKSRPAVDPGLSRSIYHGKVKKERST